MIGIGVCVFCVRSLSVVVKNRRVKKRERERERETERKRVGEKGKESRRGG